MKEGNLIVVQFIQLMIILKSQEKLFGDYFILKWSEVKVAPSFPTHCNIMDYTVHGILKARILEWGAFPFSRGSSQPRDWTQVSGISGRFFTSWVTRAAQDNLDISNRRMGKLFMAYVHSGRICKPLKAWTEMIFITWEKVCAMMLTIKKG